MRRYAAVAIKYQFPCRHRRRAGKFTLPIILLPQLPLPVTSIARRAAVPHRVCPSGTARIHWSCQLESSSVVLPGRELGAPEEVEYSQDNWHAKLAIKGKFDAAEPRLVG